MLPAIEELTREHDHLLELVGRLRRLAEADDHDGVRNLLDHEFAPLLGRHAHKEEHGVFRALRSTRRVDDRLDELTGEHRTIEALVEEVHRGRSGWQHALGRLADDLSSHVMDEEVDLFPSAMYELDDAQWEAVADVHTSATTPPGEPLHV